MKEELVALGPQIEEKAAETERIMQQLVKDQDAVNEVRSIVLTEEQHMRNETELVQEYANEAQRDLNEVVTELVAARESLETLKKADISEIRYFTA
jgi:dynein heavy chain